MMRMQLICTDLLPHWIIGIIGTQVCFMYLVSDVTMRFLCELCVISANSAQKKKLK